MFAPPERAYEVKDIWRLKDGDFVTLTNRVQDCPTGFDLHPLEVSGSLVPWMLKRVADGYKPDEPTEGPNLWKVLAGDRIAWVGPPRAGLTAVSGILEVVTFRRDSLVYGEPIDWSPGWPTFGAISPNESPGGQRLCAAGGHPSSSRACPTRRRQTRSGALDNGATGQ